jgi:hypothetical protein
MVKIMDIRSSSKEPGGYLKNVQNNDMVQALRGIQPRCSWDGRTLSKKDRDVKIFELKGNRGRRPIRFLALSNYNGFVKSPDLLP